MAGRSKLLLLIILLIACSGLLYSKAPALRTYHDFIRQEQANKILISSILSPRETSTISMSANSVVRIMSRGERGIASSTGTILEHEGNYYVLSVAHGILSDCENSIVWTGSMSLVPCEEMIVIDRVMDYSIMKIDNPGLSTPIKIKDVLPNPRWHRRHYSLMNRVYYTGFPNSIGPLTITGNISGFADDGHVYISAYAWSGSSGSSVFTHDGKLIGLVTAIDIGNTPFGPQVLEDVVIMVPATKIDWTKILGD